MRRDLPLATTTLRERASVAVEDERLQAALAGATDRMVLGRYLASTYQVSNWEEMRTAGRAIKGDILSKLPDLLGRLADQVEARGGHVHWAADAAEARGIVAGICEGARVVVKSKSMASEEVGVNEALEGRGIEVVETDLGEWIIQLAGETPSHIIAPAIHRDTEDVAELFNEIADGKLAAVPEELTAFARERLREKFLVADVGISGVNFGVAETGTTVIVTNEGNGRMVTSLPRTHIALMGMERVVETWEQLDLFLALLTRAATGQEITTYTSATTGPRREGEQDGPDEFHLVVLDNGRSDILGTELQEVLHCIRCGACLNVCPVYRQLGGHGYGGVYAGPIGAVLTPLLDDAPGAEELSEASSLCGACWEACPVGIPLQDLLLSLRRRKSAPGWQRAAWRAWAEAWSRPRAYRASVRAGARLPDGLVPRWTEGREVPRSEGPSFREWWERNA